MSIGSTDTKMVNHHSRNGREYIIMCTTLSDTRQKRAVDQDLLSLRSITISRDTLSNNCLKDLCLNENNPELTKGK